MDVHLHQDYQHSGDSKIFLRLKLNVTICYICIQIELVEITTVWPIRTKHNSLDSLSALISLFLALVFQDVPLNLLLRKALFDLSFQDFNSHILETLFFVNNVRQYMRG